MIYERALRPVLYSLPAETAHHLAFGALRAAAATPGGKAMLTAALAPRADPALVVEALGLRFPTPIGLAAGFDKDAIGFEALAAAGFGFVEIGTLTAQPQPGNPRPRLFRLPKDRALVNRMGFNNRGSADAAPRLARPRRSIVGVNIGKSKLTPESEAIGDYVTSTRRLAAHADYLVVNVSSPNTPGLRDLQAIERLEPLLVAVRKAADEICDRHVPLLVKIAPDLADDDVDAVADLARAVALDGIVATNTTIRRDVATPLAEVERIGAGGLSGAPLRERSFEVLRRLRRRVGPDIVLVSVGGIEDAEEAWRRIQHGASLLQIYTGYIYRGPGLPRALAEGLAERARVAGFARIADAVGTAHSP
jgi:dihydroorotate dehydrogenase